MRCTSANRVFCGAVGRVPFEMVIGRSIDLSHLLVFGCPAYVHFDKSRRRKLHDRAWIGIFVCYAPDSAVWLVYNPRTRRVERSRNVVFDASKFTRSVSMGEESSAISKPTPDDDELPSFMTCFGFQNSGEHEDTNEDDVEPDNVVEGWGSFRAVTCLHTMIGFTGYRTRDVLRIRRALYRLTEKACLTYVATFHICTKLRYYHAPPGLSPDRSPAPKPAWRLAF
jgi:hypothetical protein